MEQRIPKFNDFTSNLDEAKTVSIKRKYTESHPSKDVQITTPVRNSVLNFVAENDKVTKQELKEFFKQFNEETGRASSYSWYLKNKSFFNETKENSEIVISLSKLGQRALERTVVNETGSIFESSKDWMGMSNKTQIWIKNYYKVYGENDEVADDLYSDLTTLLNSNGISPKKIIIEL